MRAVTIPAPGDADALVLDVVPDPRPGPHEVVLDVAAAAVNRADILQRQGFYPPPPGASEIPGLECAGTIRELGTQVSGWQAGDQVCALLTGGGYAEQVAVPAGQLLPLPDGVPLADAAALPEVACTVWSNVVQVAGLRAGETLLVHGGSSGIGTMAIQVARALGARVAVTAGSAAKLDRCRELGAGILVNYRDQDFVQVLREQGGADVILDNMGAKYLDRNVRALATGGRLVVIGMQGGTKAELNLAALLAKRGSVHATSLRARPDDDKARIVSAVRDEVWPMIAAGTVRPVIHARFPLDQVARAHRLLGESGHVGKVLLDVNS